MSQEYRPNAYGAFLIKPDATELGLTDTLLQEIQQAGFDVEFVKRDVWVNPAQVETIWTKNRGQDYVFKSLNHNFARATATAVIVSQNGIKAQFPHETVHDSVVRVKGKGKESGIRGKYQTQTREDLIAQGLEGDDLLFATGRQTRIHGADSDEEFTYLAKALITEQDLSMIQNQNPQLHLHLTHILRPEEGRV